LIDDNLIASTCVTDGVDRTLACSPDSRDADIHRINAVIGTLRECPLAGAGDRDVARSGIAHAAVLSATGAGARPTAIRGFVELE
jgi:hypothetical protein